MAVASDVRASFLQKSKSTYLARDTVLQLALQILSGLLEAKCELNNQGLPLYGCLEVVSPPEPKKSPFRQFVLDSGIALHEAPYKTLRHWTPPSVKGSGLPFDIAIVASFGYFVPARILNAFALGSFNVHPSLLPKYRGASPIQYAIINMDTETGVSIIELDPNAMDAGSILLQSKLSVPDYCSIYYDELEARLASLAAGNIVQVLKNYAHYKRLAVPQSDPVHQPRAPKFDASLARVSFQSMSSRQIYALHRALSYKHHMWATMQGTNGLDIPVKFCQFDNPTTHSRPRGMTAPHWQAVSGDCESGSVFYDKTHECLWVKCARRALSAQPSEGANDWIACRQFRVHNKSILYSPKMLMSYQLVSLSRSFFS